MSINILENRRDSLIFQHNELISFSVHNAQNVISVNDEINAGYVIDTVVYFAFLYLAIITVEARAGNVCSLMATN
jgi:hypothetical protein